MNPQRLSWFRKALEITEFSEKYNIRDTNERKGTFYTVNFYLKKRIFCTFSLRRIFMSFLI